MEPTSQISRTVMRRVHIIHTTRPIVSRGALASFLFLIAVFALGREVWVAQVLANMPSVTDVGAVVRFFALAFLNTQFIVQVLLIVAGGAFVYTLREIARTVTPGYRTA